MNSKRFTLATLAVFVFVFLFDWAFHGSFMAPMYEKTEGLWRSKEVMDATCYWLLASQVLFSFMFSFLFVKGYENRGISEGVRYGIYIALLLTAPTLMGYWSQPFPTDLTISWIVGGFAEAIGAGVIMSLVYRGD